MSKSNYHATSNLYEASYLLAKGFKINSKDDTSGRKTIISFDGQGIGQAAMDYYNGGMVNAKAFTDAYRTLKDYIFER